MRRKLIQAASIQLFCTWGTIIDERKCSAAPKLGNSKNTVRAKAGDSLTDKRHKDVWQEVPINSDYKRKPKVDFHVYEVWTLDS